MISIKRNGALTGAGVISAIAASLCCLIPVVALIAGTSTMVSNLSWIEPARPYLIVLSIAALGFAWFVKLKPTKNNETNCCSVPAKHSVVQSKAFLCLVTVFAALMMAFPLYAGIFSQSSKVQAVPVTATDNRKHVLFMIEGMTCAGCEASVNNQVSKINGVIAYKTSYVGKSSLVTYDPRKVNIISIQAAIAQTGYIVKNYKMIETISETSNISFYEAPLVCAAAPSIGCGSKAKFMLVEFEKYTAAIESAWLNRTGTIVAVKWKSGIEQSKKDEIINTVSKNHGMELVALPVNEAEKQAKSFARSSGWFKGKDVDKLSKEEAQIIAKNTIEGYKKKGIIKPSFEMQFQAEIAEIYQNLFLSISSYKDLTTEAYNKIEQQIQAAGEKYVGKGKMPKVELCTTETESCEKDKSCTEGKSCCEQK